MVVVDPVGNAYVTGETFSFNTFPTRSALQAACRAVPATGACSGDVFATKMNASGSGLIFSTYLGGTSVDAASGIALDTAGDIYVTGSTGSLDFPVQNALEGGLFGGGVSDGFVMKLGASGSALMYSRYLGGGDADSASSIAVVSPGVAYVTGRTSSSDFPVVNATQPAIGGGLCGDPAVPFPCADAFLTRLDPGGAATFSSYFGGSSDDQGLGMAVHEEGPDAPAYLTGVTSSTDLPTAKPLQATFGGGIDDAFVVKIGEPQVLPVAIDIKPNAFPNTVNLGSGGTVAVAIFSTSSFDAATVDPTSVTLASAPVRLRGQGTPMASLEHVNGDGLLDLVLHVSTQSLELSAEDVEAILNGVTFDGAAIQGADTVRIVP